MIEVEIPDKKMIIEFPDGMEQQEMMSIINEQVYGKVVETEIPTTITQKKPLGALLPKDIDLAPPDYPGGLPEDATGRTGKLQVPTLDQPPYTELGLPVGEPRVLGKAIDIPFIPGREIARAPGAFTEAEPFDIERKEASISDLGGKVGRELLQEGAATEALPHDITKREQIGDMGEAVGRLVAETGVEIATANIMIKALAGTIGSTARAIRESTAWRKLTIPERRLTIQSLDDVIKNNPNMSEGDILRRWGSYKDEALAKRAKPEAVATGKPPIKAEAPLKAKPTLKAPEDAVLSDTLFKEGAVETGKPVKFHYSHNKEKAPDMGATFAQDIEPSGKYVAAVPEGASTRELRKHFDFGVADIKNPLVLEHKTPRHGGWKTDLSNMYNGKTGKELSEAVRADGHDGIITVDKGRISESVIFTKKPTLKVPELLKPKAPALTPEEAAIVKERAKGKIPTMLREQAPGVPKRSPEEAAKVAKIIKEAKAEPKKVRVEDEGILVGKEPAKKPTLKAPEVKDLKEQVYKSIDRNVFRESVSKSVQNDGQKLLDALDSNNVKEVERIAVKYQKDVERDQGGGGAGPGKVKQARPGAAVLGKMANEVLGNIKPKKPTLKPPSKPKESKTRTLRGRIVEMGKINFLNYTGEVKGMPSAVRYLSKKSGITIDNAVDQLISDGWLDKGTTVASFLEDLRTNPDLLKRDRVTRDISEKKDHELSPQEKKFKKETEWEPEAPPKGPYVQMRAEDLPKGAEVTIIEGKSRDGWDRYKVTAKDPFSITLVDGETIELKPLDEIEVLKRDLPKGKVKPKEPSLKQKETWFSIGNKVANEYVKIDIAGETTILRPRKEFVKKAAENLGISQADAIRGLSVYNSGDPVGDVPDILKRPIPDLKPKPKPPTKQPKLIEPKEKLFGAPEKAGPKPKLVKPEKLKAVDLVSRKESAALKQDGIWAPKQKALLAGAKPKKPRVFGSVREPSKKGVARIEDKAKAQGIVLDMFESKKFPIISLSKMVVPKSKRGTGIGTKVMQDIVKYADSVQKTIELTPTTEFGATSKSRLVKFYKQFGFVENKGKNKRFDTKEGMYRSPTTTKPKALASAGEPKKGPIPGGPKKPGKPIITVEQKKRIAKKKEVKEKQINIESAKEAKEQVRTMIIQRRKNLNLTAYETNLFVNEIDKITTKAQREVIPFIIEKTDIPKELKRPDIEKEYAKNKEMLTPLADQVQKYFDAGWQNMKKHIPDMSAEQIENYVTHIWDLNKKQKRPVTNWFITQNRFLKKRYIETLKEGIKLGFKPRTLDIGEIIQIHDSVMNRAIENKKFVDDLKRLRKDDVPLIERADKAPQDWVYFDHPALQRALVIPGEGVMGEKISPALASLLDEMGVAIGRRISPVVWGKPTRVAGQYRPGDPPEVRFQRFMSNKTIAHEIGHHLDEVLELGEGFLNRYKSELYAINRERIESLKGDTGKYGQAYAESKEEQIAEYFATLFTDADKAYKLAPNATVDALERLKKDGVLSQLINFDFEKSAKNLIEEQLNTMVKLPVKVHPDLEKPLKVIFDSRLDHAAIQAYEMVNGILKKSVLSLSLFHHAALGETGIATMGAAKTLNIYLNPIKIYNAMVKGEYDIYEKIPIAKDAIKHGLQVGATHDIPVQMIQDKLNALARKTKNIPLANKTTQLIATFNEKWDKALWNYLHDTLKLHAYESLITKIDPTKNVAKQKTEVAQFVNDTFGGQNWDMMMLSPKTVQIMTWSLLSADWTTSTIRQALSPTGIGAIHEETKGLRRKLGAYFWIKAGLYFGVGINMLNYTFRKWDEEKNPQYYKDKKMTFWDRTMAGNVIGKKTNLFVGRYGDGTERYIRWGKQFRELFEFFYDDTGFSPISAALKKIGGKLAPVIQQVSQIFTGVSPSGFKNDDVYGKKGWDKTYGIFKTLIKAPIPFASRNLLTKGREFNITDVAFPSSKGMTRYRSMELFKHAVMKNDERFLKEVYQDTLKNNLPAYTLFSAAITSLKAETSRELNSNRKEMADIKIALKKAAEIGDIQDIKRIESRLKRIIKETVDRKAGIKAYNLALIKLKQYKIETKPKKQTGKLVSPNKSKNGRLLKGD